MIPEPWQFALLALAGYRLWRLAAIDDVPPLPAWRNRIVGARQTPDGWMFARPLLAHMLSCGFCAGFHVSWMVWAAWSWQPHWTLVAAGPLAISAAVGLIAANLAGS